MSSQDVVETIASDSGRYRAEIRRRPDGLLQVHLLRWTEEVVPDYGKVAEFWEAVSIPITLTDDRSRACELAIELLRNHESI